MFTIELLPQHVSGIIMPIIRRTRPCTTAYGVLHWLYCLWLCGAGSQAVCTVTLCTVLQCTQLSTKNMYAFPTSSRRAAVYILCPSHPRCDHAKKVRRRVQIIVVMINEIFPVSCHFLLGALSISLIYVIHYCRRSNFTNSKQQSPS